MKKFNFSLLAGLLLLISASVCAENTPEIMLPICLCQFLSYLFDN